MLYKKINFIGLFMVIILLTSCSGSKYMAYNYIDRSILYNDKIGLKITSGGDAYFENPRRTNKRNPKPSKEARLLLKNKDFFAMGTAYISYKFDYKLYFDDSAPNTDLKDTITQVYRNEKTGEIIYKKPLKKGDIYFYWKDSKAPIFYSDLIEDGIVKIYQRGNFSDKLSYWDIFNDYRENYNPLLLEKKINEAPIEPSGQEDWNKLQILTTVLSRVPDYENYKKEVARYQKKSREKYKPIVDSLNQENAFVFDEEAVNRLTALAKERQVMMLNETHWMPEHRILAQRLLKPLRDKGFKYLAAEALSDSDPQINERNFPLQESGYYIREPYFGNFIREALRLGFILVPYDINGKDREKMQAQNIKKILDEDKDAKIFVYAGIGHIYKNNLSGKLMAEYFKELTGIDPLTIDQVKLLADIDQELALVKAENVNDLGQVDYYLINNISTELASIYSSNDLKTAQLSFDELKNHLGEKLLLSVYDKMEFKEYFKDAVPVYNKVLTLDKPSLTIELPPGQYQITIVTKESKTLVSKEIKI